MSATTEAPDAHCGHIIGHIGMHDVTVSEWNKKIVEFAAVVDDFNVRGQRDQIPHPGHATLYKFCPECGKQNIPTALGLMDLGEAFIEYRRLRVEAGQPAQLVLDPRRS